MLLKGVMVRDFMGAQGWLGKAAGARWACSNGQRAGKWAGFICEMFLDFLSAFLVASAAYGISKTGSAPGYGEVIIGNIMLLVPGVAFVNGLRDN